MSKIITGQPAIFLDRDRTISTFTLEGVVQDPTTWNYITSWDEFEFLPMAIPAFDYFQKSKLKEHYITIVVTNQGVISRENYPLVTAATIADINHAMRLEILDKTGHRISAIYTCPHLVEDDCDCKKPKPGLIKMAADEFCIDLERSWMIGDADTDIQAGYDAGIRRLIKIGEYDTPHPANTQGVPVRISPHLLDAFIHVEEIANYESQTP